MRAQPKRSDLPPCWPIVDKSSSEALADANEKPFSPEKLDNDEELTEPALDDIDSLLSILDY